MTQPIDLLFFKQYPEFVTLDPQCQPGNANNVPWAAPKNIFTVEQRFKLWTSNMHLEGLKILDLGCGTGAFGAWCLAQGAASYTGVDINSELVNTANTLLKQYFPDKDATVYYDSLEEFLDKSTEKYHLIVAGNVLAATVDYYGVLGKMCEIGNKVIIESVWPEFNMYQRAVANRESTFTYMYDNTPMVFLAVGAVNGTNNNTLVRAPGIRPNLAAVTNLLQWFGFDIEPFATLKAEQTLADEFDRQLTMYNNEKNGTMYWPRFLVIATKNPSKVPNTGVISVLGRWPLPVGFANGQS